MVTLVSGTATIPALYRPPPLLHSPTLITHSDSLRCALLLLFVLLGWRQVGSSPVPHFTSQHCPFLLPSSTPMSASRSITRVAASRLLLQPATHSTIRVAPWSHPSCNAPLLLAPAFPSVGLATHSNPTSTLSHRPDALDPKRLLSRRSSASLTQIESRGSVLDLYRKICRLLPQVLKAYELQGEDSYHRALRNIRFHFENHRRLADSNVVEVLRHKAEMEIEEAMLMYDQHAVTTTTTAAALPACCHSPLCCLVLLYCQVQDQVSRCRSVLR